MKEAPTRSFREEAAAYMRRMQVLAAIADLTPQKNNDHPLFKTLATLSDMMMAKTNDAGELKVEG